MSPVAATSEQGLKAPTRHTLDWKDPQFADMDALNAELERVFDICHGCRRCVNLCQAFPTLFDLIDNSETFEIDGVAKEDYSQVVRECYLCDLCFMTKCPYVPPHSWNVDFPHLMLRAKYAHLKQSGAHWRDRMLSSTDGLGKFLGIPIVAQTVNAINHSKIMRRMMEPVTGIHHDAQIPQILSKSKQARSKHKNLRPSRIASALLENKSSEHRVLLFSTCYINSNYPKLLDDLIAILEHNHLDVQLAEQEYCCGMPKMELGSLEEVERLKNKNIPHLKEAVEQGRDIIAAIPSCVLMFRKELPLLFPDDPDVQTVSRHFLGPFEYLKHLQDMGHLNTQFTQSLGNVVLHSSCHQRVQLVGHTMREIFGLIPDTEVTLIDRCSGHDGTYAIKRESYEKACKIGRPVARQINTIEPDHYGSDCPLASEHIGQLSGLKTPPQHPINLLRCAYGL